jgi:hypothetical protein
VESVALPRLADDNSPSRSRRGPSGGPLAYSASTTRSHAYPNTASAGYAPGPDRRILKEMRCQAQCRDRDQKGSMFSPIVDGFERHGGFP